MSPIRVPGRGPKDAKIMLIGEAPGEKEELSRQPFVGPAGNLLMELLLKAGLDPDAIYFTNVCKYRPPENKLSRFFSRSGLPNDLALESIMELQEEIDNVNPNLIIACGNWPLWVFGHANWNAKEGYPTGITSRRGYIYEATKLAPRRKILATLHPSYIQRGAYGEAPLAVFDLRKAHAESKYPDVRRRERRLILDPRGPERDEIRSRLLDPSAPFISFDIEYIGTRLVCIGFTTGDDWAATVQIRSKDDVTWCKDILESGRPLCAQNGISDCGILEWYYGFDVVRHLKHDTMEAAYVLNIEYPKDLGFLGAFYTDLPYWKEDVDWNKVRTGEQSMEDVLLYNARDTVATHEIALGQIPELASDPAYKRAFDFDMAKITPLWEMSREGVRIDLEKKEAIVREVQAELLIAEDILSSLGGKGVNVASGPQLGKYLFDQLKIPSGGKTPGGLRKTDDKTLAACMIKASDETQKKAISAVRSAKEARSLISKFGGLECDADGRMRCHYDPTKAGTRRLSSRKFGPTRTGGNLQNIGVRDPRPRTVFIPDEPDTEEFAYADLKGAEFEVVAQLTQDPEMLRLSAGARAGILNVHKETGAFLFDIDAKTIDKHGPFYYLGKKTRHSGNYMIGWKTFMENVNAEGEDTGVYIDAAESKRLLKRYEMLHPGLRAWWNETEMTLRRTHTLANLFGFKRIFHDHVSTILPVAVAFVPQSTIGDALNMGLMNCWEDEELKDYGFRLRLQIHDAIGYKYLKKWRYEVNRRVRELLDVPILIPKTGETLHIPVEVNVGPSWGECEEWSEDLKKEAA